MEDLSRCNDIVNAISNNCKRLVRCVDGSVVLTNQEIGNDLNADADACRQILQEFKEDPTMPRVFTNKFKADLLAGVYKKCIPFEDREKRTREALAKASLPGLTALRRTLTRMLAEVNDDTLTSEDLSIFFDKHLCDNPMCVKDEFKEETEDFLPRINVFHPEWFYFPTERGYLSKAVAYIKIFLKDPCSRRCALCNLFFDITEGDEPVDLFGLPEQYTLNDNICSLYGKFTVSKNPSPLSKLIIKRSGGIDFIATWGDKIFF